MNKKTRTGIRDKQAGWYTQIGNDPSPDHWSGPFASVKAAIAHETKRRRTATLWLVSVDGIATYAGPTR